MDGIDGVDPHHLAVLNIGLDAGGIGVIALIEYCRGEHFGKMGRT